MGKLKILKSNNNYDDAKDCALEFVEAIEDKNIKAKKLILVFTDENDDINFWQTKNIRKSELTGMLEEAKLFNFTDRYMED